MKIKALLNIRAEKDGEKPFLYFQNEVIDFSSFIQNVHKAGNMLLGLGVRKGDHVCLFLPNCPEFLYIWFGLAKIGGVMIPLNVNLRGDGLKYIINHCDAKWIIVNERFHDAFEFVEKDLTGIQQKIWHGETSPPNRFQSMATLMDTAEDTEPGTIKIEDNDPLGIIYTSGTTGRPKGAVISHFNYINTGKMWAEHVIDIREDDILFTTLPLFHANAQMFTTMGALWSGRPFVLRERFSASRFFDEIRQYRATIFNYIGGMLTMLMKQPEKDSDPVNSARATFGGAAPREIWQDFERRFDVTIIEGYGLTESGGLCIFNPPDAIKVGSIGKPAHFCEISIWDDENKAVPDGESGEIVVREKDLFSMFLKYYKQPEETENAWTNGWFHTGDKGCMDEDGYYFFIDRIKDCIRRRGENISSFEIEKIVNSYPEVLESAAVAVPSELGEDEVKIYIIPKFGKNLDPEDIISYCEERMAYFMVPRYVEFLKEFPKTPTERTQKFELRKIGIGNAWDREKADYKLKRL